MSTPTRIRPRERDAIIQSLRVGVVPRVGQHHIQVGRSNEVSALLTDIDRVSDGGSCIRFIIGEYGAGKSFFLNLVRAMALEKTLVTMHADLTPNRRLYSSGGEAKSLYAELTKNLSTKARPDGGAIGSIVEKFINQSLQKSEELGSDPDTTIRKRLAALQEMTGGYDFAEVIVAYWKGHDSGSEKLKIDAIRWLRGEISTRTDARMSLGVRTIVDDANVYDHLKLLGRFCKLAGYAGLLVVLDEMVNLYKLEHSRSRRSNYEQILRILNDCMQGSADHIGFVFGGTPEFLTDTRRGLYSYAALQSRLAENTFAADNLVDYSAPVLRIPNLTPEDMYVLLGKLRHVYASGDPNAYLIPDEALEGFMNHCSNRVGSAYFRTPRNSIKEFINLLAVLDQNPNTQWEDLIEGVELAEEGNPDLQPLSTPADENADVATATATPAFSERVEAAPTADPELSSFRI